MCLNYEPSDVMPDALVFGLPPYLRHASEYQEFRDICLQRDGVRAADLY
jgi:hypothetical protein